MTSNEKLWELAKALHLRWINGHGLNRAVAEDDWKTLDEWKRGYWFTVAEFVDELVVKAWNDAAAECEAVAQEEIQWRPHGVEARGAWAAKECAKRILAKKENP